MGLLYTLLVLAAPIAAVAQGAAPTPIYAAKGEPTFIDDAFALAPGGDRLAFVRTDGADLVSVEVVSLADGKTQSSFSIASFTKTPERLAFTKGGSALIVVSKDPASGRRAAQVYDLAGKAIGRRVGPATDIAAVPVAGKTALVAYQSRGGEGAVTYDVSAVAAESGKSLGRRALRVDRNGIMARGEGMRILYFFDGYTRLVGQKKGEYDKQRDVRRPDRAAVLDVLTGKELGETEIGDVIEWAREVQQRSKRPNQAVVTLFSEDLKALELLTAEHKRVALELARPTWKYEPKTLVQQSGPEAGQIYFSLLVDPVNQEAVKNQKAEPDIFDLYVVDGKGDTKPRRLFTGLAAKTRALSWVAGGGRVAVLHKHKGFDRGGALLEVYELKD